MASAPSRSTFDPMASAIKPVIEQLEGRTLLSVSLADDGTLTLDGTAAGDEVTVKLGEKKQLEVSFNGDVHYFARHEVRRIMFDGGAGDDSFRYMNYGGKGDARVFARGGDGDDIIATGHADDAVYGDAGDDLLSGGSGDNKISGGEGNDTLVARDGNDRLLGGAGEDQVAAGRGKKLVRSGAGADLTGSLQPQFPITTFTPDPAGYSPEMQRYAYGLGSLDDPNYTNRGQGQAIAIVGAFDLPNIHEDMDAFTRQYELPGMNRKQLRVINLAPKKRRLVAEDWYGEAMLDAQWAHAIAPKARIYMVQAATNAFADINAAVERAKRILNNGFGGGVISMSLGSDNDQEFERVLNTSFRGPDTRYISFVVSAGDTGGTNSSPSTSPNVVSVGGTALYLNQFGSRVAGDEPVAVDPETGLDVWGEHHVCDDETGLGITDAVGTRNVFPGGEVAWHSGGGGPSNIWDRPAYQENRNLPGHPFFDPLGEQRATPDIAWNGDPATGVGVYNTVGNGGQSGFGTVGGTSAGAPQFAGLVALVNQLRAENGKRPVGSTLIDRIYRLGGRGIDQYFYDVGAPFGPDVYHGSGPIVSIDDELCNDIFISPALPGWDFATGWGSPNGSSLIPALAEERIPLTSGRLRISGTFTGETTAGVPEWIGFNGTTRAAGYGTVGVSAMTTTRVYRSTQAGGGGGVGTVDNSVFVIDFFGDDAQDGRAQRNVWTPVVDANGAVTSLTIDQASGDIVTLYKHGKSVQGLAYVTITELPAADPGGGGGGGGGQPPAGIVRTVPIRFVGSAGKKGTISGEFFAIGPDGERIERGFNPDDPQTPVLLVRGQFRWD